MPAFLKKFQNKSVLSVVQVGHLQRPEGVRF